MTKHKPPRVEDLIALVLLDRREQCARSVLELEVDFGGVIGKAHVP